MPNLISPSDLVPGSLLDGYFYDYLQFQQVHVYDSNLLVFVADDSDYKYLKLENQQDGLLSVMRLEKVNFHDTDFYCVNKSKSIVEKQGYASMLYEYCFNNLEYPTISDKYQSKAGSSDLWNKLIKKDRDYDIFSYNTLTNKYIKLEKRFNPYLIWGMDDLEIVEKYKLLESFDESLDVDDDDDDFDIYYTGFNSDISTHPLLIDYIRRGKKVNNCINIRLVGKRIAI